MGKTYAGTYLYSMYSEYEKKIFSFIMSGTEIDKDVDEFEDIAYEIKKRNISNALVKVLMSDKVILMSNSEPLSKAFKVFCAKDLKGKNHNALKVYIDCSNIITKGSSGVYQISRNNVDILISYLVSAMHTLIYYADEKRLTNNHKLISTGAEIFASLFTHIVDYVCKISTTPSNRNKCKYLAALYFFYNLLEVDYGSNTATRIARKVSGISEREANVIDIQTKPESYMNIKYFVETVSDILRLSKLTLDVVVEKWMFVYGTGTVFGLEMFPAFASMITDSYVGAYVNNQKTIEKVAGTDMIEFTKTLLNIGSEAV